MTKAAIPVVNTGQAEVDRFAAAVKQNVDAITGQTRGTTRLPPLPQTATLGQVITRLNELLDRLQ
jgi:hypothetical protein